MKGSCKKYGMKPLSLTLRRDPQGPTQGRQRCYLQDERQEQQRSEIGLEIQQLAQTRVMPAAIQTAAAVAMVTVVEESLSQAARDHRIGRSRETAGQRPSAWARVLKRQGL